MYITECIVTFFGVTNDEFWVDTEFIDILYTPLRTTISYSGYRWSTHFTVHRYTHTHTHTHTSVLSLHWQRLYNSLTVTAAHKKSSLYSLIPFLPYLLSHSTAISRGSLNSPDNYYLVVKAKVRVTLRLAVYRQSIRLDARPLETRDQRFLFQLNSCGNSPYVTSSLTRRWGCLLWICLAFLQVYISHI
jgi:hypothetical protein